MSEEKLKKYQRQLRELKAGQDKAKGALEHIFANIKDDFKVNTMQEFERKIKEMKKQRASLQNNFNKKMDEIEKAYKWE